MRQVALVSLDCTLEPQGRTRSGAALTVIHTSALPMGRHASRVALAPSRRENRPTGAAQQRRRASADRAAKLPRVDWTVFGRSQGWRLSRFRCPEGLTAHRSGRPKGGRLPMQRRGPYAHRFRGFVARRRLRRRRKLPRRLRSAPRRRKPRIGQH